MRAISLLALLAWMVPACSGGSDATDTTPGDLPADTDTVMPDTNVTPDLPPDQGQDLSVLDVTGDQGTDPGQPDTPADAVESYATCYDLFFQCVARCDDGDDQTCETACIGKAEPAAAAAMATLGACVGSTCSDMAAAVDYIDCLGNSTDKCGADFHACVGGTSNCRDVRTCWLSDCPTGEWDHECALGCLATGDAQAKERFAAFYGCIFENCGAVDAADFQACYMSKAGNECANHNSFCDQM